MAAIKVHEAENFLRNKPRSYPILLIYGPDSGLAAEYAALFAKNCGADAADPFAMVKMEAESLDKDPALLIDEAQTIAFFGGKRLIWVSYSGTGSKGKFTEAVKFLLENPPADCFILITAGDLKKGVFLRKIIEDSAKSAALPCYADESAALQKLIQTILPEFNCTISEEARLFLQDNLGGDRRISRSEVEKLCLYAQEKRHIEIDDVKNSVSEAGALSQNDVADAVICGDIAGFNKNFDRYLAAGAPVFLLLSAMMRQFQQLQGFCFALEQENKSVSAVLSAARPPVFFKRRRILEQSLTRWTGAKIERAMERLHRLVLDSRQNNELGAALIRQNLLALAAEAARHGR